MCACIHAYIYKTHFFFSTAGDWETLYLLPSMMKEPVLVVVLARFQLGLIYIFTYLYAYYFAVLGIKPKPHTFFH